MHEPGGQEPSSARTSLPILLRQVSPNTKFIVVGDPTMTNHRVEKGRREFLVTVAGGIAGLTVGSSPARPADPPSASAPSAPGEREGRLVRSSSRPGTA
jgi:hypothetical protein